MQLIRVLGKGVYGIVEQYQLQDGNYVAIKTTNRDININVGIPATALSEIYILQILRGCSNILQLLSVKINNKISLITIYHTSNLSTIYKTINFKERLKYANSMINQILTGLSHLIF